MAGWPLLGTAPRDSPFRVKRSVPRSTPGYLFLPPLGWVALCHRARCKLQDSTQTSHVATLFASNNGGLCTPSWHLQNKPGLYTHFPRNNSSPTIVDIIFTRGQATLDILDWTLGNDFSSEHLSTHLYVCNWVITTVLTWRLAWFKANWETLAKEVSQSGLDISTLGSTGEIERSSENYTNILHKAIDIFIPKIGVNQQRKIRGWWNRVLDQILENLRQLQAKSQQDPDNQNLANRARMAWNCWQNAI